MRGEKIMIRLSAFADEASPMLDGQIAAMKRNGIEYLEIRGVNGENIANISCEAAKKYANQLSDSSIKVWSIGSPIGKVKIASDLEAHRAKLRHVCELANIFGTDKVRMFSFVEAYESRDKVLEELAAMVGIAADYGVELIGCESQTVGPEDAPLEVHKILLEKEVVILEGISLAHVPGGVYFLNSAPISIQYADGSPCRAILLEF